VTGSQARRVKGGAVPTDQFRHPGSQGTGRDWSRPRSRHRSGFSVRKQQNLVPVFKALGDPTRLKILELLKTRGKSCCDLVERAERGWSPGAGRELSLMVATDSRARRCAKDAGHSSAFRDV